MYKIIEVKKLENVWYMYCIKYNSQYRYYGIVYNTEYDHYIISLMDGNFTVIDHFKEDKNFQSPSDILLNLCTKRDKFWYPELFVKTEKKQVDQMV
jgi:hypothetical protein